MKRGAVLSSALALALLVLFFEEGVHAVHHLPDYDVATTCSLAAASSHDSAATAAIPVVDRPLLAVLDGPVDPVPICPDVEPVLVERGRAPPLS
jgi:hypothetical protein